LNLLKYTIAIVIIGADLGFAKGGTNLGIVSVKQGIWGTAPPRSYRVFNFKSKIRMFLSKIHKVI